MHIDFFRDYIKNHGDEARVEFWLRDADRNTPSQAVLVSADEIGILITPGSAGGVDFFPWSSIVSLATMRL